MDRYGIICYSKEKGYQGGKTMAEKYKYWTYNLKENECLIDFVKSENLVENLEIATAEMNKHEKEAKEWKQKRDMADNSKDRTEYANNYLVSDKKYHTAKSDVARKKEQDKVLRRNKDKSFTVKRLKDIYSRKENVVVTIRSNDKEDCKIVSTTNKINEDIYKVEEYGIYLTPPYLDELAKIVREVYFDIEAKEDKFIDNEVPPNTIKAFVAMCNKHLEKNSDQYLDKNNKNYYNIPVKTFKDWYENSAFRRFSLTSIKEALIIHGYARCNTGRNDLTVASIGKAISLNIEKINEVGINDDDKE